MSSKSNRADRFYGYKDISFFTTEIVHSLFEFPPPRTRPSSSYGGIERPIPPLPEFLSYILLRTALPRSTIYHAFHLLGRISHARIPPPAEGLQPETLPHFVLLSSLVLATVYSMDSAYSHQSWSIAAKDLFTVAQIDHGTLWMLSNLDWLLRIPATRDSSDVVLEEAESLTEVADRWEEAFQEWKGAEVVNDPAAWKEALESSTDSSSTTGSSTGTEDEFRKACKLVRRWSKSVFGHKICKTSHPPAVH